jgi:hypothetical protein
LIASEIAHTQRASTRSVQKFNAAEVGVPRDSFPSGGEPKPKSPLTEGREGEGVSLGNIALRTMFFGPLAIKTEVPHPLF